MTDLQMLGNSFCEFGLVSTNQRFSAAFDPKAHLFENCILKMLAQLHYLVLEEIFSLHMVQLPRAKNLSKSAIKIVYFSLENCAILKKMPEV